MNQDTVTARMKTRRVAERLIIPLGIIVFCLVAFWLTTQFDRVPPILKRGIQPSDFPQLVIGLILSLAIITIFTDRSPAPQKLSPIVWKTIGLLCGFVAVVEVDLFIALGIFAAALSAIWGERRIGVLTMLGITMPLAVFFLFDFVFEIRFPRGLLTTLWYG